MPPRQYKINMTTNEQIEATNTYQKLVLKTPFLKSMLLKKQSKDEISTIVYQIEKLGMDYIKDKSYDYRSVEIAKEIIENRKL